YMPVGMQHIVAPPELMLAQMTYARVDHCVLQAGGGYGAMNDYNAFAQHQYPGQFTGLLNVDEPRADTDAVLAELDRAHHRLGLRGVYYGLDTFARYGFDVVQRSALRRVLVDARSLEAAGVHRGAAHSGLRRHELSEEHGSAEGSDRAVRRYPLGARHGTTGAVLRTRRPVGFPGRRHGHVPARQSLARGDVPHHVGRCLGVSLYRGAGPHSRRS